MWSVEVWPIVGMIIPWALVNILSSLAIWSLKGQFGFKSVGCCWMWVSQPSLIISFNAPSFASKLLCSLIICNILLQAEGRPREFGRSFRGWVHDSLLIMLNSARYIGLKLWNPIPNMCRNITNFKSFKRSISQVDLVQFL